MLACEQGNLEIVEILLEHKAGIEIQTQVLLCVENFQFHNSTICTQSGWTAVMIACENGHLDIVRVLVEKQANINHRNKVSIILCYAAYCLL